MIISCQGEKGGLPAMLPAAKIVIPGLPHPILGMPAVLHRSRPWKRETPASNCGQEQLVTHLFPLYPLDFPLFPAITYRKPPVYRDKRQLIIYK